MNHHPVPVRACRPQHQALRKEAAVRARFRAARWPPRLARCGTAVAKAFFLICNGFRGRQLWECFVQAV
jgi:hypothetical protein